MPLPAETIPAPQSNGSALRIVMADDERLARDRLRRMLHQERDCVIVAEADDGISALEAIRTHAPDALFLDVDMPGLDGLKVVAQLPPQTCPAIVLVTAHPEHAVQAFEVQATDYLLKPVPPQRLAEALERCRAWVALRARESVEGACKRFVVRSNDRIAVVEVDEIDWIGSADNYVILHVGHVSHVLRETMTAVEGRLPPGKFIRISRSALVNVKRIREIVQSDEGPAITAPDGQRLPITRGLREVLARLETA